MGAGRARTCASSLEDHGKSWRPFFGRYEHIKVLHPNLTVTSASAPAEFGSDKLQDAVDVVDVVVHGEWGDGVQCPNDRNPILFTCTPYFLDSNGV
jgi:hypothetical protein